MPQANKQFNNNNKLKFVFFMANAGMLFTMVLQKRISWGQIYATDCIYKY